MKMPIRTRLPQSWRHRRLCLAAIATRRGPVCGRGGITIGDERSDVRRLLEHALHDSLHHVGDVTRGLALIRVRP